MVADELAARRWFRQRLEEIGEQYPELKTPVAQERLAGELARQAREGEGMAEVSRRGRPKGSTTATVPLETVSFKAPKEFMERLRKYAGERRVSLSELVRDGLEWRLTEGDPMYMRAGGTVGEGDEIASVPGLEALQEAVTALTAEVRLLRQEVRSGSNSGISSNTYSVEDSSSRQEAGVDGAVKPFNPATHALGRVCKSGHIYPGTVDQTLYRLPKYVCPECDKLKARERRARKRQAGSVAAN